MRRYHPALVTLHWLLACLILFVLITGFVRLAATPNFMSGKIDLLRVHMATGMAIFFLMLVRMAVRLATAVPSGPRHEVLVLDRAARLTHAAFYLLVITLAASGFATALLAQLPAIVFAGSGGALPTTFLEYPTRVLHGYAAIALAILITVHVLAAIYHLTRGDGIFGKILFGRRRFMGQSSPR